VLAVDRLLSFPHPTKPKKSYTWKNHVAPTVPVAGVEYGVMVIDPAISPAGPVLLVDWLRQLRVKSFEVSTVGLAQPEILRRQTERNLQGVGLDAMTFLLRIGEAPGSASTKTLRRESARFPIRKWRNSWPSRRHCLPHDPDPRQR
jgi:hypothetical protein